MLLLSIDEQDGVRKGPILRVPSLYAGESFSSGLDRAASLWGVTRPRMVNALSGDCRRHNDDLDAGEPHRLRSAYCCATGMNSDDLIRHLAARCEMLLAPSFRYAYCPLCFADDLSTRTPYFRLDWGRAFLTHCQVHGSPLFQWRETGTRGGRKFPHTWYMGKPSGKWFGRIWFEQDVRTAQQYADGDLPRSAPSRETWRSLLAFESLLAERKLGDPIEQPRTFAERDIESRLQHMLVELLQPQDWKVENCALYRERPDYEDHAIIAFNLRTYRAWQPKQTWKSLRRSLVHLACRRAALVALARGTHALLESLRPKRLISDMLF